MATSKRRFAVYSEQVFIDREGRQSGLFGEYATLRAAKAKARSLVNAQNRRAWIIDPTEEPGPYGHISLVEYTWRGASR